MSGAASGGGPAQHWDARHAGSDEPGRSWFQLRPALSLELVELVDEAGRAGRAGGLVDVGGGASRLVDHLLAAGWTDLTVLDVSAVALQSARSRVGEDAAVAWVEADVRTWRPRRRYAVWHDRAVFHFLVDAEDRAAYLRAMAEALAPGGLVVVGTFAADGPTTCSGLPVARYAADELVAAFGGSYREVARRREEHRTPSGAVQPFTWVALRGPVGVDALLDEARAELSRVEPLELAGELAAGALVVDIRPSEQRLRDGDLPGALVVDRNVLEWRLDPTSPYRLPEAAPGRRVVVVCNEGFGSSLAAATLRRLGVDATDLVGGFQAWLDSGGSQVVT